MKKFGLQPLRIPSGWLVRYNTFSEYDPSEDDEEGCYELTEDLLQIENGDRIIDLGWYPEMDMTGWYVLQLLDKKLDRPFDAPIEEFGSRSKREIISMLEHWAEESN